MRLTPTPVPPHLATRIPVHIAAELMGIGETTLLAEPLIGIVASRECPGYILIETLERVRQWAENGRVLVSGFHSPLEQQVLRSHLRRNGRAVKVMGYGFGSDFLPPADELDPITHGRLLLLSTYPADVSRATRKTALERNRLVLSLASEVCAPYVASGSPLASLLSLRSGEDDALDSP